MNAGLLESLLRQTPLMEPVDAVKLVFQSAMGCGHALGERAACAQAVRREWETTPEDAGMPAFTPIGGGLCRLNLASPAVRRLPAERVADWMRLTARHKPGDRQALESGLEALRRLAREGRTPFGAGALDECLDAYRRAGRPVVSHSEAYRRAYAPAYRVILENLALLMPVVLAVEERLARTGRALVVLDGDCGAGKTTLAGLLGELYDTAPLSMDDFFLPPALRTPQRLATPGGNIDAERFAQEVLGGLLKGGAFAYRRYDCHRDAFSPRHHAPGAVSVIEGSYSHHPRFAGAYEALEAVRVFVSVDEPLQRKRIARRNPALAFRFQNEWIPLEKTYFQAYDIAGKADIVLSLPEEETP